MTIRHERKNLDADPIPGVPGPNIFGSGLRDYLKYLSATHARREIEGLIVGDKAMRRILEDLEKDCQPSTVGDGVNLLSNGFADPAVVEAWIEQKVLSDLEPTSRAVLFVAIERGYPALADSLRELFGTSAEWMRSLGQEELARLNPNVVFREFRQGLRQGVGELISQIQREEFGIDIALSDQPDLADIPGFYQRKNGNFWVAMDRGKVIGTVGLLDIGEGRGALRKMFVHKEYRGSAIGVASNLLDGLLDWARSRAMKEIWLGTTDIFIAAHRFYEKAGFERVARGELPEGFPIMKVDSIFYRLRLGTEDA